MLNPADFESVSTAKSPTFRVRKENISIGSKEIQYLTEMALNSKEQKSRILFHSHDDSRVHEMLIVKTRNCNEAPHSQKASFKSYKLIAGELEIKFSDRSYTLDSKNFYLKFDPQLIHQVVVKSDIAVYMETLNGPLSETKAVFVSSFSS